MLGKAVKLRHCPATVSAPARRPVLSGEGREPARVFPPVAEIPCEPLQVILFGCACGKVAGKGASQETGPSALNPLAFRGERRSLHACFRAIIFSQFPRSTDARVAPRHCSFSACCSHRIMSGSFHPRRSHGRIRRQGHRRQRGSDQRRQSRRRCHLHG